MKLSATMILAASLFAPAAGLATVRVPGKAKLVPGAPYPAEAKRRNIEGNVVLTGEIGPDGKVVGLTVLASSSPFLEQAALTYVSRWGFGPATENGKPVSICLNAVVRFRKDKSRPDEPGELPAPMTGNLALYPVPEKGSANPAVEGFPVQKDDRGVRGDLDLDFPSSFSARAYSVDVTDVAPSGKTVLLFHRTITSGGKTPRTGTISFFRPIRSSDPSESGLHTVRVSVDGKAAGGARYRVGPKKN